MSNLIAQSLVPGGSFLGSLGTNAIINLFTKAFGADYTLMGHLMFTFLHTVFALICMALSNSSDPFIEGVVKSVSSEVKSTQCASYTGQEGLNNIVGSSEQLIDPFVCGVVTIKEKDFNMTFHKGAKVGDKLMFSKTKIGTDTTYEFLAKSSDFTAPFFSWKTFQNIFGTIAIIQAIQFFVQLIIKFVFKTSTEKLKANASKYYDEKIEKGLIKGLQSANSSLRSAGSSISNRFRTTPASSVGGSANSDVDSERLLREE
jgi:hypothetical protein